MPAPGRLDTWKTTPLLNYDANRWLRAMLGLSPATAKQNVGMHSCKVTLLAWAARYGLSLADRKLLGYQTSSQDETALLYSRDAMSSPLRELSRMLADIRKGGVRPR